MRRRCGIQTQYRGFMFRSMLEARWAAFFDLLGWEWDYEPFELEGYIPDFVLRFPRPLLVEVKPDLSLAALEQYAAKIEDSRWTGDALIVGASPLLDEVPVESWPRALGLVRRTEDARWTEATWGGSAASPGVTTIFLDWDDLTGRSAGGKGVAFFSDDLLPHLRALWGRAHTATRWLPGSK